MCHDNGRQEGFTDGPAVGSQALAVGSETAAEGRLAVLRPVVGGGERPGLGGLRLLLVPLACRDGPLLIAILAAGGTSAWGALGLRAGVIIAVTVMVIYRTHRGRACCETGMTGWAQDGGTRIPGGHWDDRSEHRPGASMRRPAS